MTVEQLDPPLALNVVTPGTEDDNWGEPLNENATLTRQAVVEILAALALRATLVDGKVPSNQLPAIAINDVFPAANQAAMLALSSATPGDIAIRADTGTLWALTALPASTLGNWTQLSTSTGVVSINGETGVVSGFAKVSGSYTWTGTHIYSNPVSGVAATDDAHFVTRAQLISAIAGAGRFAADIGDGSALSFTQNHGRGTADVQVTCWDKSVTPRKLIVPDEVTATSTQVTVTFLDAPATNGVRLVVM